MMWRFDEVSLFLASMAYFIHYDFAEKLLQAVAALSRASGLNPDHPELHIRLIDLKQTGKPIFNHDLDIKLTFTLSVSSLPQLPPAPIGPVFADAVSKLVPDELSLDTFNSLYLQRHSTDPQASLAAAKVSHNLKAPRDEVETLVFALLEDQVKLNIPVSTS